MKTLLYAILPCALALTATCGVVNAQTTTVTVGSGPAAVDFAAKRKVKPRRARTPSEIACTVVGCIAVPPGCHQEPGKTWDGEPTAFDVIVCP